MPSTKTHSSTLTKSQKLLSKTQKAHSKVQKPTSTERQKIKKAPSIATTTTNSQQSPPTLTCAEKLLPSAAAPTLKSFTCTSTSVGPRRSLSQLTGYVKIPKYAFSHSPYSPILMFKERSINKESVKHKSPYKLRGPSFAILPHFKRVEKKSEISNYDDSDTYNNGGSNNKFKTMANPSRLRNSSLPGKRRIFPIKKMQVYVEEYIPCSNTNKYIDMDTKEETKKEIQKQAELIALTLPPPPFPSELLTFKCHVLKHSTAQKDDSLAKPRLRPSLVQVKIDRELEVLKEKEKERKQNWQMSKYMVKKENHERRLNLYVLELRERAEATTREEENNSQEVKAPTKTNNQQPIKSRKAKKGAKKRARAKERKGTEDQRR